MISFYYPGAYRLGLNSSFHILKKMLSKLSISNTLKRQDDQLVLTSQKMSAGCIFFRSVIRRSVVLRRAVFPGFYTAKKVLGRCAVFCFPE